MDCYSALGVIKVSCLGQSPSFRLLAFANTYFIKLPSVRLVLFREQSRTRLVAVLPRQRLDHSVDARTLGRVKNLDLQAVGPFTLKPVEKAKVGTLSAIRKPWFCTTCLFKELKIRETLWSRMSMEKLQLESWIITRTNMQNCQDKLRRKGSIHR